jgi:hypothetical protein
MAKVKMTVSAPYFKYEQFTTEITIDMEAPANIHDSGNLQGLPLGLAEYIKDTYFDNEPDIPPVYEYNDDVGFIDWEYEVIEIIES